MKLICWSLFSLQLQHLILCWVWPNSGQENTRIRQVVIVFLSLLPPEETMAPLLGCIYYVGIVTGQNTKSGYRLIQLRVMWGTEFITAYIVLFNSLSASQPFWVLLIFARGKHKLIKSVCWTAFPPLFRSRFLHECCYRPSISSCLHVTADLSISPRSLVAQLWTGIVPVNLEVGWL